MPHNRFFTAGPLEEEAKLTLDEGERRHLRVLRLRPGERVEVVNGHNVLAQAVVEEDGGLRVTEMTHQAPPEPQIIVQGLTRPNRLDTLVEKGTELGMTALWLFPGDLSEKTTLSKNQLARLHNLSIAAMKQCGRLDLPEIIIKPRLKEWESLPSPAFFGDTDPAAPRFNPKKGPHLFAVGPESGFSPEEEKILRSLGAQGVRLHPNILRAETAPLAALSLISIYYLSYQ